MTETATKPSEPQAVQPAEPEPFLPPEPEAEPEGGKVAPEPTGGTAPEDIPSPLPDGWQEREEAQSMARESHGKGWREGFSKASKASEERLSSLTERARVSDGLRDLISKVEEFSEQSGLLADTEKAKRALNDLLGRSEVLARAVTLSEEEVSARGQGKILDAFLSMVAGGLPKEVEADMANFAGGLVEDSKVGMVEADNFWPSLFKKRDELVARAAYEKGRKDGIEAEKAAGNKASAAEARKSIKGPEVKTPGHSSGGHDLGTFVGITRAVREGTISEEEGRRRWNELESR